MPPEEGGWWDVRELPSVQPAMLTMADELTALLVGAVRPT